MLCKVLAQTSRAWMLHGSVQQKLFMHRVAQTVPTLSGVIDTCVPLAVCTQMVCNLCRSPSAFEARCGPKSLTDCSYIRTLILVATHCLA